MAPLPQQTSEVADLRPLDVQTGCRVEARPVPSPSHAKFTGIVVYLAWGALTLAAFWLVLAYSVNMPATDEWSLIAVATGQQPLTWRWIFSEWNGHHVPLVRLILLALYKITNLDFRAACYLQVVVASVTCLILLRAARREDSSWTTLLFPLALLGWFHWYNWVCGWQIQFTIPVCLACLLILPGAEKRVLLRALGLAIMPLFGTNGVLLALPIIGWCLVRSLKDRSAAGAALAILLAFENAVCLIGLHNTEIDRYRPGVVFRLQDLLQTLGSIIGYTDEGDVPKRPNLLLVIAVLVFLGASIALRCRQRIVSLNRDQRKVLFAAFAAALCCALPALGLLQMYHGTAAYPFDIWQLTGLLVLLLALTSLGSNVQSALIVGTLATAVVVVVNRRVFFTYVQIDRYPTLWLPLYVAVYFAGRAGRRPLTLAMLMICLGSFVPAQVHLARRSGALHDFLEDARKGNIEDYYHEDRTGRHGRKYPVYYNPAGRFGDDLKRLQETQHPSFPQPVGQTVLHLIAADVRKPVVP